MSMKILSPAGDLESLKMAVFNGADEVYLGVKDFNARNIEGFSMQTLKQAVDFSHIFGVKVNLAVNILFKDDEIQSALDLIVDAYNLGVDSFIIQDIGLASLVQEFYPEIEMHASTQLGVHNLEGVKEIEELGFKRVVLARETPIQEIKRIKENSNIEIEYFCQGALCVSFSGNCYLSSYLHNASGNRGKCKQLCRLPYSFRHKNKEIKQGYLLSAKDFNMLNKLKELEASGVDVLKIEGRARRPYYVAVATKTYKNALNNLEYNLDDLRLGFNRDYTEGYFNGNGEIISNKQNHIGIEIGKVIKFKNGKKFNEIFISSNREISPKSVLKFFNQNEETVITAYDIQQKGNLYRITTTQDIKVGASVNLISDLTKEQNVLLNKVKRNILIDITAKENNPITAIVKLENKKIKVEGEICVPAKNQPVTATDITACFKKHELFSADINVEMGNVFLPKQKLNEFRRNVYEKVQQELTVVKNKNLQKISVKSVKNLQKFSNFIEIFENFDQKNQKPLDENIKNVIYTPSEYELKDIEIFIKECKKKNVNPYLNLPVFATEKDVELLKSIITKTKISVVLNNLYALSFNANRIVGGGLNVFNKYTAKYFNLPYIQAEESDYKMPYMTLRHCPMKSNLNANCSNCPYKEGYEYVMQNGKHLKLRRQKISSCTFYLTD